jgi:SAM-dependent methyltransferase
MNSIQGQASQASQARHPSDVCFEFLTAPSEKNRKVLDVGFGHLRVMNQLRSDGHQVWGVEIDPALVEKGRQAGFECKAGMAERLPYETDTFDLLVSSVVLPYTIPHLALPEMVRVIRPGGKLRLTSHSYSYGWNLLREGDFKRKIYGARMLVNTVLYELTGHRIPGFLGDSLCHSATSLINLAKSAGLKDIKITHAGTHFLSDRFFCLSGTKPG